MSPPLKCVLGHSEGIFLESRFANVEHSAFLKGAKNKGVI